MTSRHVIPRAIRDFYARPSPMTDPGRHAARFDGMPEDIGELARIVQGLVVYPDVAAEFYGFQVPRHRKAEMHIRPVEALLDRLSALDARPLHASRPLDRRLVGRCHHFMVLLLALLRARGIAARARCGFGAYFNPGHFEDHWVCETWNERDGRWALVDPQFDAVWREKLRIRHDVLDVPRDAFLVAADAWDRCRRGEADPARFGILFTGMRGLWFVAGSLVRDLAALNKVEVLPWDVWGAQPAPDEQLDDAQLALFDRLAALTREPDRTFSELRRTYDGDQLLRVGVAVTNALRRRTERIPPALTSPA